MLASAPMAVCIATITIPPPLAQLRQAWPCIVDHFTSIRLIVSRRRPTALFIGHPPVLHIRSGAERLGPYN